MLTALSQSGTRPGTFQYVPEGGRIPVAVNNIYTLAFESSIWARLIGAGDSSYKVIIENEANSYKALVYLSENDLEDCKIEIHKGELVNVVDIEPCRGEHRSIEDIVHLVTAFISSKISAALDKGIEGAKGRLQELAETIDEAERRLNSLYQDCSSLRPYKRKQLYPFFTSTNELIADFKKVVGAPGNIDNIQFANLNGLANKVFLKRSLEKKIMKESGENMKSLFESDEKVDRIIGEFDKNALEEKYSNYLSTRNLKCGLSSESWVDLLTHGDCLCLTLNLERPQNLLGNAYEIKIKNVNYLTVSHDSFLNSKLFETKAGQMIQGERSYAHGQVPPKAFELIPGLSNEAVNGVLPIFINEDHWKIASLRTPQMMGYNVTVDVLGFNPEQILVFPFLAYAKALEQNSELLIELLRDTCDQIYRENREQIIPKLLEALEKYTVDPLYRLEIKDNSVFLGWLSSASRVGDVADYQRILVHVLEEEIRRNYPYAPIVKINELVVKLLKIDVNPHFDNVRANLMKGGVSYAAHFRTALHATQKPSEEKKEGETAGVKEEEKKEGETADVKEEEKKEVVKEAVKEEANEEFAFSFTGRITELPEEARLLFDKINSALMSDGSLFKFVQLFKELGFPLKTLEDFGLIEVEQKLSFLFQALGYKRDRKDAVENNLFINSYDLETSIEFVQNAYTKSVQKELLAFKSKILGELYSNKGSKNAAIFSMTTNLKEAARCVYLLLRGSSAFPMFYKALQQKGVPKIIEKVKMLTLGHYLGKKLIFDHIRDPTKDTTWNPKNKIVHRIWLNNKESATKEQWQEAFPGKFEYFEHKYLREAGVFVPFTKPSNNVRDPRHS